MGRYFSAWVEIVVDVFTTNEDGAEICCGYESDESERGLHIICF